MSASSPPKSSSPLSSSSPPKSSSPTLSPPRYYSAQGGTFINSGTYGCAFEPPVECHRKKIAYPVGVKLVGKIFSNTEAFKTELSVVKMIRSFDKYHRFTVPYYGHCQTHSSKFKATDETYRCTEHITNSQKSYPQIVYQYGGIDLKDYYTNSSLYPITTFEFLALFYPLLEGIQQIHAKSYAHADIKPPNLLFDPEIPKLYLIDFGLITQLNKMSKEDYLLRHDYPYYPPEFKILYAFQQGAIHDSKEVYESCLRNFNYYGQSIFILWIQSRWPTYTRELRDFVDKCLRLNETEMTAYFNRQAVHTIDSYGLAMTILEIIYRLMKKKTIQYSKEMNARALETFMHTILFPMIRPDPDTRMTVADALPLYSAFFSIVKPAQPAKPAKPVKPAPAPAKPAPAPVPLPLSRCKTLPRNEIIERLHHFQQVAQGTTEAELCQQLLAYYQSQYPVGKQIQKCHQPESKGGIPIVALRAVAKSIGISVVKRQDICNALVSLAS